MFITFEGGEGSGKTTQISLLADYLESQGHEVVKTREPGGTPDGEKIRDLIVSQSERHDPLFDVFLLFSARRIHVNEVIKPALEDNKVVICDRFTDSTRVYQGYGLGVDLQVIETLKILSIGTLEPDLTFVFDINPEIGLSRAKKRSDEDGTNEQKYETYDKDFHERLRTGFRNLVRQNPGRFVVLDAGQDIDAIRMEIQDAVTSSHFGKEN